MDAPRKEPDWSSLPVELRYIVGVAEKYGRMATPSYPDHAYIHLESREIEELREVAKSIGTNNHFVFLESWIIEHSLDDDTTAVNLLKGFIHVINYYDIDASDCGPKEEPDWTLRCWNVLHYRILHKQVDRLRDVTNEIKAFDVVAQSLGRVPPRDLPEIAFELLHPFRTSRTLDWIESHAPKVVTPFWGWLAAVSSFTWSRAETWFKQGRPLSLIALDALRNLGTLSESPVVKRYNPRLIDPVPQSHANSIIDEIVLNDPVPRVQSAARQIKENWGKIT